MTKTNQKYKKGKFPFMLPKCIPSRGGGELIP